MADEKLEALKVAVQSLNKDYGAGAAFFGTDIPLMDIEVIPTGSATLDDALGIGGIPRGRITEIYGQESSGKTTLCLHILAEAQKLGGRVAFIDMEHALDLDYAAAIGVNRDELLVSQPDNAEQALETAERLARSGAITCMVIDSVAALVPKAEVEGEMGDQHMGLQARLMSQAMRKLSPVAYKTNTTIIFTNQIRMKIGIVFGNPEVTSGGNSLKYYASVRLEIKRKEALKEGEDVSGNATRVRVVKSKVAPPFKVAEFNILFGQGIDKRTDFIRALVARDLVKKAGPWYSSGETKLGQGEEAAIDNIYSSPELLATLTQQLKQKAMEDRNARLRAPTCPQ